jgi:G3E family GTPase
VVSAADIPVTVIGGYLGAGKTTLINRLLARNSGQRLAVLVNDFGAINIDASLIQWQTDQIVALSNGCVCCTIADDLGETLTAVAQWTPRIDQVVIEASGVAEPAKIAMYGQGWPGYRLAAALTVVDGTDIQARATDKFVGTLVQRQIAQGDVLIISKDESLSTEQRRSLERWLEQRSPGIPITLARGADQWLLDERAVSPKEIPDDDHAHFSAGFVRLDDPISRARFDQWSEQLPASLVRVKGYVRFLDQKDGWTLVQRVGRRTQLVPVSTGAENVIPGLVAIGIGDEVQSVLEQLQE